MRALIPLSVILFVLAGCTGNASSPPEQVKERPSATATEDEFEIEPDTSEVPEPPKRVGKGHPLWPEVSFVPSATGERETLRIEIFNDGEKPVRIWQTCNSWGNDMLNLDVRLAGSRDYYTVSSARCTWTINSPSWQEIPPGGSVVEHMNLWDGYWWSVPKDALGMTGHVEYRVRFSIYPTEEAQQNDVYTTDFVMPWAVSASASTWLPDEQTGSIFSAFTDGPSED